MLIINEKEEFVDLEFEIGKTYKTKFQTGELFRVEKIITRPFLNTTKVIRLEGIYLSHVNIGICPIDPERLIPERKRIIVEDDIVRFTHKEMYDAVEKVFDLLNSEEFNELKMKEEHGIWKSCAIFKWYERNIKPKLK